jgi:hypothetical protein
MDGEIIMFWYCPSERNKPLGRPGCWYNYCSQCNTQLNWRSHNRFWRTVYATCITCGQLYIREKVALNLKTIQKATINDEDCYCGYYVKRYEYVDDSDDLPEPFCKYKVAEGFILQQFDNVSYLAGAATWTNKDDRFAFGRTTLEMSPEDFVFNDIDMNRKI